MKSKKNIKSIAFVLLALMLGISFVIGAVVSSRFGSLKAETSDFDAKGETSTYAKAMAVIEADSGRLLYQKNCNEQLAMASTTKIMTALVAVNSGLDFDEVFKVDPKSVGIEGTSLYLRKNEEKTLKELLYGLMLPSGNDAAVAIACRVAGSEEEFVKLMNKQAKDLGLKNTSFANPHGLDAENHYTSAYDLAIITAEAMKNDLFREIVSTKNVRVSGNDEVQAKLLKNKNKLLWNLDGCEGVKTGFTDNAKRCFVSSTKRDNMRVICVVLNCGPMFEEAARLTNMAFENYKNYNLLGSYTPSNDVKVEKGVKDSVETFSIRHFSFPLTYEEYNKVEYKLDLPSSIEAPVEKEQKLGKIEISLYGKVLFTEDVYATEEVKSTKFFDKIEQIVDYWNL
mgnify:CR=1 FL=1